MPGILPMKVIKVGVNAQARIAQACDRCRSKKIRCDGVRPCCSQCAHVGFECKTSDKLSRRAFPRGYTESLEERVRSLEHEVRDLKDLLDEKDEKIDILSRLHSNSTHPIHQLPSPRASTVSEDSKSGRNAMPEREEMFKVLQSPYLLNGSGSDSYFAGTSSARMFIEAFKQKVQEQGRSTADIDTELLLAGKLKKTSDAAVVAPTTPTVKAPPRLVSDQLINIFFQEWAPLFPVLHRPTFLTLYEKFVSDTESVTSKAEIAQLNLVFGIAELSSRTGPSEHLDSFESQWKAALDTILTDNSMATLQTLILAQIFCVQQGDLTKLLTYKGLSTALSAHLGLQQSQKRFALGTLTCETRKKVFWTLYTVDGFTAVMLGLPKHIKDDDVHCEYPVDADDEYVTERGFQPTLPGESTKLSSALALFRAARILSKVLDEVFPAKTSYDLSLKKLSDLSDELDAWSSSLAPHLRLQFTRDKPSTGTISSRSPLLSLTYHYIRALIQRPAICASLGVRSRPSMITMASSCKHVIQIIQLLVERGLSFSFCLNRDEVLVVASFGLLFQGLNLDAGSKILKDNKKLISVVIEILSKSGAPCASEFRRVACSFLPIQLSPRAPPPLQPSPKSKQPMISRHNSDTAVDAARDDNQPISTKKQLKAMASRFTASGSAKKSTADAPEQRRATIHTITVNPNDVSTQSRSSLPPTTPYDPSSVSRSEPARSPTKMYSRPSSTVTLPSVQSRPSTHPQTNLDYLSFGNEQANNSQQSSRVPPAAIKSEPSPTDWEKLMGSLDNGQTNIFDATYGGPPIEALVDAPPAGTHHHGLKHVSLGNIAWNADLWALYQTTTNTSENSYMSAESAESGMSGSGHTGSVLSFSSDDGLSSGNDDFTTTDWTSVTSGSAGAGAGETYRGIVMPEMEQHGDELSFANPWENPLNL